MEFLQNFRPTSKVQLKQVCQWFCNGDVKKAQEMYDYYAKDIELPDFDPVPPSFTQNTKDTVIGMMSWLKENQDTIANLVQFGRSLFGKASVPQAPQPPLPPIN